MKENISTFTILKNVGISKKKLFQSIKIRKLLIEAINNTNKNTKLKLTKKILKNRAFKYKCNQYNILLFKSKNI